MTGILQKLQYGVKQHGQMELAICYDSLPQYIFEILDKLELL